MNEFEIDVIQRLARIEERTQDLSALKSDVATIKTRVGLLEFKASAFGAVAGAVVVGVKAFFGRG